MCSAGNLAGFLTDHFSIFHSLFLAVVIRILTCALRQKKRTFSKLKPQFFKFWFLWLKLQSLFMYLFVCIHSFIHSDLTKRKQQSIPVKSFWSFKELSSAHQAEKHCKSHCSKKFDWWCIYVFYFVIFFIYFWLLHIMCILGANR